MDDHMRCDETDPQGCRRCRPKVMDLCCDICNPAELEAAMLTLTVARPARAPAKSHIKPYSKTQVHFNLRGKIFEWRRENATKKLGAMAIRKYGPELFLPDQLVDRIVDCSQYGKITSLEHLLKETHWRKDRVTEFGDSLLNMLQSNPINPTAPLANELILAKAPVKERRCGVCGQTGHNRELFFLAEVKSLTVSPGANALCPSKVSTQAASHSHNNENVNPFLVFATVLPSAILPPTASSSRLSIASQHNPS